MKDHRGRKTFTVELLLDVVAKDAIEAEIIGKSLASYGRKEAKGIIGAIVSDVRDDEENEEV